MGISTLGLRRRLTDRHVNPLHRRFSYTPQPMLSRCAFIATCEAMPCPTASIPPPTLSLIPGRRPVRPGTRRGGIMRGRGWGMWRPGGSGVGVPRSPTTCSRRSGGTRRWCWAPRLRFRRRCGRGGGEVALGRGVEGLKDGLPQPLPKGGEQESSPCQQALETPLPVGGAGGGQSLLRPLSSRLGVFARNTLTQPQRRAAPGEVSPCRQNRPSDGNRTEKPANSRVTQCNLCHPFQRCGRISCRAARATRRRGRRGSGRALRRRRG